MLPDVRIQAPSGTPSGSLLNRFNNFDGLTAFDAFLEPPGPVGEDSSRLVCEKTRARLLQSSRLHHLCRFISWESEEIDERPHALFLTAARKSPGSC